MAFHLKNHGHYDTDEYLRWGHLGWYGCRLKEKVQATLDNELLWSLLAMPSPCNTTLVLAAQSAPLGKMWASLLVKR